MSFNLTSIFRRPDYKSEVTQFIDKMKTDKPMLESEQRKMDVKLKLIGRFYRGHHVEHIEYIEHVEEDLDHGINVSADGACCVRQPAHC